MTANHTVERIDVTEGPNLESLMVPWFMYDHLKGEPHPAADGMSFRFQEVAYFNEAGEAYDAKVWGKLLHAQLAGIQPLAGKLASLRSGDFVITVVALDGIFSGHYNTLKRKGSLLRVRTASV